MKICKIPQHYLDWEAVNGREQFLADYAVAPTYYDKRTLIESVPLCTNPKWLEARRCHITASTMKDFLGMDRSGKQPGVGYKKIIKRLVAEQFGWEEAPATWNEKAVTKRGLVFEARAKELFEKETGIKLKSDIGFISEEIDGLPFGYSPDAYDGDIESKQFNVLAEIKSFELCRIQDELEILHSADTIEQMQGGMEVAQSPICYKILYCAELDKIFYTDYKRAPGFKQRLLARIPIAKEYRDQMIANLMGPSNLTDVILNG